MSGEDLRDTSANGGRLLWIVRESLKQNVLLARNTYSIRLGESKSRESTPCGQSCRCNHATAAVVSRNCIPFLKPFLVMFFISGASLALPSSKFKKLPAPTAYQLT